MVGLRRVFTVLVLAMVPAILVGATPPGIANNPSHATCTNGKYKYCKNLVHVCPKFCPNSCTVECVSCKPICSDGSSSTPPPEAETPPTTVPTPPTQSPPSSVPSSPSPTPPTTPPTPYTPTPPVVIPSPSTPPTNTPLPSTPTPPTPTPPSTPTPQTPSPSTPTPPTQTPPSTPTVTPTPQTPSPNVPSPSTPTPTTPTTPSVTPTPQTPSPSVPSPSTPTPSTPTHTPTPQTPSPNVPSPSTPTPTTPSVPPTPQTPSPSVPSPSTPTPSTPTHTPTPQTPSPNVPSPSTPTPTTPSVTPTPQTPSPSVPSPSTPTPSTPTHTPTPQTPSPSSPTSPSGHSSTPSHDTVSSPSSKKAKCNKEKYPNCYNTQHVCPTSCPGGCQVDCVTCKPVCSCDMPGAVCQDPRFIGGNGITFYFHGQKDHDFCLVSDPNLHINAHFIGKRNENMSRDFTWVQSIAILFNKHTLFLGALKTSTWDDSVDRISLAFDGQPLTLPNKEGQIWQSKTVPSLSITRVGDNNDVVVEVEGNFKITAKVVPIGEQESRVHNYGITKEDCFAHLDLGFKFYSLSDEVNGVLGQTYKPDYVSHINVGAKMPVLGRHKDFITSSLFAPDCAATRFSGDERSINGIELPSMKCESGIDGQGVVCKR